MINLEQDCWCEHCGPLEPYTATLSVDFTDWCMDCALASEFITQEEVKQIIEREKKEKIEYFEMRIKDLKGGVHGT